ncbi:hypothetical protein MKW92_039077 [Papaver armeniacum]|nr:hypothetical protein MKW92_039077 [Papaver armeniacum]
MMMGTSDKMGGGGGGGGGPGNFLFENQTWASVFSSINSDNSGGVCSTEELHKTTTSITSKKLIDSTSTSPRLTPIPTPTPTPTAVTLPELVVGQTTSTGHQKRSRGGGKSSAGKGTSAGGDWNECKVGERKKKKMRNMFSNLHALLPQLHAKADKSTIVDEAVNYIKTLQHSLQKQKQRLENKVLSVNGDDAQISVCAPRKPGLLTTCCYVLEKHKLEVVTTHVSSDCYRSMFMIHAHVSSHYMLLSFISWFLFFCR